MTSVVFLILCMVLEASCSSVRFLNYSLYKSKNIVTIPVGTLPTVAKSIGKGAEKALDYCHLIFQWDRWNCPVATFFRLSKQQPTRETAFSKAILAAGIVHSITRDCSKGEISECGCDSHLGQPLAANFSKHNFNSNLPLAAEERASNWSWGGCSDDPIYAEKVTKKVLDDLEKGSVAATYVGKHNNRIGREIIRKTMVRRCRCHGVSGSCSMRTCWMVLSRFEEIAKKLREKYNKAERLTVEAVEAIISVRNSPRRLTKENVKQKYNNLLYLTQSPDYCVANVTDDFSGTKGRKCSRNNSKDVSHAERKSCRNLCRHCGFKVKKIKKKEVSRCNCKFVWCCDVKCEMCAFDLEEYFCY